MQFYNENKRLMLADSFPRSKTAAGSSLPVAVQLCESGHHVVNREHESDHRVCVFSYLSLSSYKATGIHSQKTNLMTLFSFNCHSEIKIYSLNISQITFKHMKLGEHLKCSAPFSLNFCL